MFRAARNSPSVDSPGSAARSSQTALAWVTVTSSNTPSAPMIIPASSRPRGSTLAPNTLIRLLVSSSNPVSRDAAEKPSPSRPINARLTSVPSTAVDVRAEKPCVR